MNYLVDDTQKAKENRERIAASRVNQPYYWWEFEEPEFDEPSIPPRSNPKGLARTIGELKIRTGKGV